MTENQKATIELIANQMMKGPISGRYAAGSTEEIRAKFVETHSDLIRELIPLLPKGSSGIGAAIAKCAIQYDKEKAFEFAKKLKEGMFSGKNDPVYLLWNWLNRRSSIKKTKLDKKIESYKVTATACIAYCENRTLTQLRPKTTDIFQWDKNWETPAKLKKD